MLVLIQFNSFLDSDEFCGLLITFANSLDPDQARQNIGPDLDPNCLTPRWYLWKDFWENLILNKSADDKKIVKNYPACKELKS